MNRKIVFSCKCWRVRFSAAERGSALVEFSLVLPMVMVLATGIFTFGIALNHYLELTNATALAAQQVAISRGQTTDPCALAVSTVENAAPYLKSASIHYAFTFTPAGGATASNPATSYAANTTSCSSDASSIMQEGGSVEVQATYPCTLVGYGFSIPCNLSAQITGDHPMKTRLQRIARRLFREESGQTLIVMLGFMVGFLGMAAIVADMGDVYYAYNELVATTNAAALAGAEAIDNTSLTSPAAVAQEYGSEPGGANTHAILLNTAMSTPSLACSSAVENMGVSCVTYNGSGSAQANVIQVTQTAKVRTYFAAMFGTPYVTLKATATAARAGANGPPYNVAIILDTTESMTQTDSDKGCTGERISCAQQGIQVLLQSLSPCSSSTSSCSVSGGVAKNSVNRVALFAFPNIYTSTLSDDYVCPTNDPTIEPYSFPSSSATSYTATNQTIGSKTYSTSYEITYDTGSSSYAGDSNGFLSDYRSSDAVQSLDTSSNLVIATGGGKCSGVQAPGGAGTFYAGAIYAAQAALIAEQAANPNSQNVIILVSDGDASSSGTNTFNNTKNVNEMGSASTTSGAYPSTVNECGQAILAAEYAASQGTKVYTVAYGTESSGCGTDKKQTFSTYNGSETFTPTPCSTMQYIASSGNFFYADTGDSGGGNKNSCANEAQPTSSLNQIFQDIGGGLTNVRLVPNSLFSS